MAVSLETKLKARASELGFCDMRITPASLPASRGVALREYVEKNHHASMDWIEQTLARRETPTAMWTEAKSAIMLAMSYAPTLDPMSRLEEKSSGIISVYALGRDYHDVIKGRLKTLAGWLASQTGEEVKVFVDTAPVMEKPLAEQAGLGWQGKHTNLVSREHGSWFFLGCILSAANLQTDEAETDHCGSCSACLDICPTKAFPAAYKLDARRCISYLTIEHKGHIDREFRAAMGNRIYGCDDCLAVCPWNKFASTASEMKLAAREDLVAPDLEYLASLDDKAFRQMFTGSPVKRIGRDRFVRNVLIAIGNSGNSQFVPIATQLLGDASTQVRAMAVWALSRLLENEDFEELAQNHIASETDEVVKEEWNAR
ncbi:MAG: tRNA epoxyqueuosine(34) reductase QueG [Anderseniella sp.]